jgi:serine phosphatase RsbU (regulator of sigma subunit)
MVEIKPRISGSGRAGVEAVSQVVHSNDGLSDDGDRYAPGAVLPATADRWRHQRETVTDGLAQLGLDELLSTLLERASGFLAADTAAVLLLDAASQQLVATAARGIEEEVRQGVRIPLGRGFAGRIAATRAPLAIDRVDSSTVANPILFHKGIRSMLGVPLLAGDEVLGVLHVGTLRRRGFTAADARLLQSVADRAALAVRAQLSERDRVAARVLQRGLLPAGLPSVDGLDLAARYVPGEEGAIGGDWYDVFTLPSGALCLVVGDVAGHGLEAAHAMGRARTALRAYSLECEQPDRLLAKLDRHSGYFHPSVMITVLCAVLDPGHNRLSVSLAGHPPPVMAVPGQAGGRLLELPADFPIGLPDELSGHVGARRTSTVELPPGAVLCAYTDGLVERRGRHLDDGLDRLTRVVRSDTAETVCAAVMAEFIGATTPEDDVALLVVHRRPRPGQLG